MYPGLQVSAALFRRERLREVTGFSVYILVLDWSAKLNYSTDTLVIGAMMSTSAVTTWTVGQRVAQVCSQIRGQLSTSLFPIIVDSDAANRQDRLRAILIHGTSLSLALGVPICTGMWLLAGPSSRRGWVRASRQRDRPAFFARQGAAGRPTSSCGAISGGPASTDCWRPPTRCSGGESSAEYRARQAAGLDRCVALGTLIPRDNRCRARRHPERLRAGRRVGRGRCGGRRSGPPSGPRQDSPL